MDTSRSNGPRNHGERHRWAKLTDGEVARLRELKPLMTYDELATMFLISRKQAFRIVRNYSRKW